MQKQHINKQQTIRFFDKELLDKLNEDYAKSSFNSVNTFLNFCLEQSAKFMQIQTDIEECKNKINELCENNANFEKSQIKLLEQFVNKLNTNEKLLCRLYALTLDSAFDGLDEMIYYENGSKDHLPSGLKGYLRLEQ